MKAFQFKPKLFTTLKHDSKDDGGAGMYAYLGLGSNLGNREAHLKQALTLLEERAGRVERLSAFIRTAPWGFRSDNGFLNATLCLHTALTPLELLDVCQRIEQDLGRTVKSADGVYADRVIDIDLLLYGNSPNHADEVIDTPRLTLPHPLMHVRAFVLQPMAQIAPALLHPLLGKSMSELEADCR